MNCDKEYIKMCDCEEIQSLRSVDLDNCEANFEDGDYGYSHKKKVEVFHRWYFSEMMSYEDINEWLWLPRQDQLQEMLNMPLWSLCFSFNEWFYDIDKDTGCDFHIKHCNLDFKSMEQLWLAFLMQEKHSKVWNKKEWVTVHGTMAKDEIQK